MPQWMFDAASCHRMRLGPIPSVSCDVLRELQALLSLTPLGAIGVSGDTPQVDEAIAIVGADAFK